MHGGVGGRGTVYMYSPSSLMAFSVIPFITLGQETRRTYGDFNFECHGQRVIIDWMFHGELGYSRPALSLNLDSTTP